MEEEQMLLILETSLTVADFVLNSFGLAAMQDPTEKLFILCIFNKGFDVMVMTPWHC